MIMRVDVASGLISFNKVAGLSRSCVVHNLFMNISTRHVAANNIVLLDYRIWVVILAVLVSVSIGDDTYHNGDSSQQADKGKQ